MHVLKSADVQVPSVTPHVVEDFGTSSSQSTDTGVCICQVKLFLSNISAGDLHDIVISADSQGPIDVTCSTTSLQTLRAAARTPQMITMDCSYNAKAIPPTRQVCAACRGNKTIGTTSSPAGKTSLV
jgi:hypothetical protein